MGCACGGSAISRRQNTCLIAFSGSTPRTIKVCASILKRFRSERNGHLNDATGQPQIEQRASRRNWSVHRPRSADCLLLKRGACFAGTSRASPGASSTATWAGDRSSMVSAGTISFAVRGFLCSTERVFEDEQFFRLSIDKFLDLFRLAKQFLVDLREALLVLFELRLVGALVAESGVQAGQR